MEWPRAVAIAITPAVIYGWFQGMKYLERRLTGRWRLLLWPSKQWRHQPGSDATGGGATAQNLGQRRR